MLSEAPQGKLRPFQLGLALPWEQSPVRSDLTPDRWQARTTGRAERSDRIGRGLLAVFGFVGQILELDAIELI